MQALVVPAAIHEPPGEFIDNDDFPVLHHIVDVLFHKAPGLHGLIDVVRQCGIFRVRQILHAEILFGLGDAGGCEGYGAGLFVHKIIAVVVVVDFLVLGLGKDLLAQRGDKPVRHFVELGGILSLAGDNQRRTGFINQDGVHLVHDGKGVAPLNQLLLVNRHVVPEVVEAQLVVGAVGDVGGVGGPALGGGHAGNHQTDGQTHVAVDLAHPLGLVFCKVVVDGDHMDAPSVQGIQVAGQNGNQRLAFTGLHLGNPALMEHDAADELDRVGAHTQHPVGSLPDGGEGLGQQIVQRLALVKPLLKLGGLAPEGFLAERLVLVLQRQNFIYCGLDFLQLPLRAGAEQLVKKSHGNLLNS